MNKLIVHKQRVGPILGRHPWVFSGALQYIPEGLESGSPVQLVNEQGQFLAQGYFNSYSQIAVRLWSWDENEVVDSKFFEKRIKQAFVTRENFVASKLTDSYRLIHSENDLLPGLIVDKYADCLVLQFHTTGIEFWKDKIVDALKKIVKPKGIYERSDVRDRKRMPQPVIPRPAGNIFEQELEDGKISHSVLNGSGGTSSGLLFGKIPDRIKISENGYKFWVDVIGGQKTGFFLDQRDKRQALTKYVNKKSVLNCFSYTGGFSVYALGAGAKHVVSVDASESALELAVENVKLNKLDVKKCEFVAGDVKQYLFEAKEQVKAFDVIVLDPPAFVKDRHKVKEGLMGYTKINEMALRILSSEGILVSASCSAHVTLSDFRFMLSQSAGHTRRSLQVLETYTHGVDHPELVSFIEGEYLKCVFALAN
jgi:23S rRNA (cytosine1962-C5)-methyltransferase